MTTKPSGKKPERALRVRFKFPDGSEEVIPLADIEKAHLDRYQRMAASDDPRWKEISKARIEEVAQRLSKTRSSELMGLANIIKSNAERGANADQSVLNKFEAWRSRPQQAIAARGPADCVRRYLKVRRISRRDAKRLQAMLKDGRIK